MVMLLLAWLLGSAIAWPFVAWSCRRIVALSNVVVVLLGPLLAGRTEQLTRIEGCPVQSCPLRATACLTRLCSCPALSLALRRA